MSDKQAPLGDPEVAVEILKLRVAELEQAIRRLADQDATLSVCNGNVKVTMDATLTHEEREAIEWSINDQIAGGHQDHPTVKAVIAVLRALLARTK
jgi:hypothetical protein